jgi:hypothetical protein
LPSHGEEIPEGFRDAVVINSDGYIRSLRDREPKAFAYFTILREEGNNLDERARELAQAVGDKNMHPNVDEFLRDNRSLKPVIQVLIAGNLFERLYHRKDDQWTLRASLFASTHERIGTAPAKENWIRQFVGLCRARLLETEQFRRLTVVSFNYDRLMETLLREFWNRSENQYPKLSDCIEFVYPYGAFSALEKIIQDPGRWILEQAKNLSPAGADVTRDTIIARTEMDRADQIFLLGFSCSDTNMRLLEFHARYGAKTFAQNYDNLDEHLERVLTAMGARSDKGSMLQLVRNGFFKQSGPTTGRSQRGAGGDHASV